MTMPIASSCTSACRAKCRVTAKRESSASSVSRVPGASRPKMMSSSSARAIVRSSWTGASRPLRYDAVIGAHVCPRFVGPQS